MTLDKEVFPNYNTREEYPVASGHSSIQQKGDSYEKDCKSACFGPGSFDGHRPLRRLRSNQ